MPRPGPRGGEQLPAEPGRARALMLAQSPGCGRDPQMAWSLCRGRSASLSLPREEEEDKMLETMIKRKGEAHPEEGPAPPVSSSLKWKVERPHGMLGRTANPQPLKGGRPLCAHRSRAPVVVKDAALRAGARGVAQFHLWGAVTRLEPDWLPVPAGAHELRAWTSSLRPQPHSWV